MSLPNFQTSDVTLSLIQSTWAKAINPLLALPTSKGNILQSITLAVGDNTINHKLGRKLQGWFIVRKRAACNLYDKQDTNQMPDLTLVLNSDAIATVDIFVF